VNPAKKHRKPVSAISLFFFLFSLSALPFAFAANVGVVVSFPDGSDYGECVQIAEGKDGYELLEKSGLSIRWSDKGSFGRLICSINNVGVATQGSTCDWDGDKYWGFFMLDGGSWVYLPVGHDGGEECWNGGLSSYDGHYCAADNDVLGYRYGTYGDEPQAFTYEDVCHPLMARKVTVEVDGDKDTADEHGGTIDAYPGATLEFDIELENLESFDNGWEIDSIEAELIIEGIDDGDDIEEDVSFDSLGSGRKDSKKLTLTLPLLLEAEAYDATLTITGELESGQKQEIVIDYEVDIKKEKHDLLIRNAVLVDDSVCPGDVLSLQLELVNLGKENEDAQLLITGQQLGMALQESVSLESGTEADSARYAALKAIAIPKESGHGDYHLLVQLLGSVAVEKSIPFTVEDCRVKDHEVVADTALRQSAGGQQDRSGLLAQQADAAPQEHAAIPQALATVLYAEPKRSFFERHGMLVMLGIAQALVLGVVGSLFVILRR